MPGLLRLSLGLSLLSLLTQAAGFAQQVAVADKIHWQLRNRAPVQARLLVFVVLLDQPQREIVERIQGAAALRTGIAEGEYERLAAWPLAPETALRAARDRADALIVETRQAAAREIAAAIRPQQEAAAARFAALGARILQPYTVINMLAADIPAAALEALAADPEVAEVFPIEAQHAQLAISVPGLGAPAFWNGGITGAGQSVAVLDTGIYAAHPAFAGKDIVSRAFVQLGSQNDCFDDDTTPADHHGHGTHVAGIVASGGAPGFSSYLGVARGLGQLYNLKIGWKKKDTPACKDSGNSMNADVTTALDWALQNTPLKIFNYSYGGDASQDDTSMARYFDSLADIYKIMLVVSAGNAGPGAATVGSPGIGYNVLTVANYDDHGGTDRNAFDIHYSSSRGPTAGGRFKPDIAAPGTAIGSASYAGDGFVRMTGTSMAAPHVAGAAALLAQAGVSDPLAIKALLINTTDNLGWKPDRGWGYANLGRAYSWKNVFTAALAGGAQPFAFFAGTSAGEMTATAVWNRHLLSSGGSTTAYLNDLGVYLYNRSTNTLLAKSDDMTQNVQQVDATSNGPLVIKVKAAAPLYAGGGGRETFALALSQAGYTAASGPALALTCTAPVRVAPSTAFSLNCTARNSGDLDAFAVQAVLAVPAGFSDPGPASFGTLAPGAAVSRTITLNSPASAGTSPFQAALSSNSFGESFSAAANFSVSVATGGASLVVSPAALAFTYQVGGAPPAAKSISISGEGLSYSASASAAWLRVSPGGGAVPATLAVSVNAGSLAAGTYNGAITISAAGAANSPQTVAVSLTVGATPTVAADTRLLTRSVPSACGMPDPAGSFLTSDARAFVWFSVQNARASDRATAEWDYPNGTVYQNVSWSPVASAGSWCFYAALDIAGNPPASSPGVWTVKVYWNGAPLFSLPFPITSPVTVVNKMMTRSADLSACAAPAPVTRFLPADAQSVLWFSVSGARAGDQPSAEWYSPDGQVFQSDTWDPVDEDGDWCFTDKLLIAGSPAAGLPGNWTVKAYWNGALVFALPFTIVAPATLDSKVMTALLPTGCSEPPSSSIFLPGDPRAMLWFYVKNVQAGDQPKVEFYDPSGNFYYRYLFDPVASAGDWCFWAGISIANRPAALSFGSWTAKVFWNDAPFFSQDFRILPVAVDNYLVTRQTSSCATPAAASIFTPADPRVYVWFHVKDAQAGDRPGMEWYDPGGALYWSGAWDPAPEAGERCFWGWIDLANNPAASRPGAWTVKVYWNGAAVFTVPFTVSPIAYENAMLTKSLPPGAACALPVSTTAFSPADSQAIMWFVTRGARTGDQAAATWYDPNGKPYRVESWDPVPRDGDWCLSKSLPIASQPPASFPGAWSVQVTWNGTPLFTLPFTIQDQGGRASARMMRE